MGKYDDILHLPHHVSPTRRRMTMAERAAQFSPFAALTGYGDVIRETGRVTDRRVELEEDEKAALDRKQQWILAALERGERPEVKVICFQADERKEGGEYHSLRGRVKRIDGVSRAIVFADGSLVRFRDILDIEILPEEAPPSP